jgi:hypothetical protein
LKTDLLRLTTLGLAGPSDARGSLRNPKDFNGDFNALKLSLLKRPCDGEPFFEAVVGV